MRVVITLTVFDMVLISKYFYVRYIGILEALNMYVSSGKKCITTIRYE